MFGDPHLVTLDGYQYTFNGKGEFVLVETHDGSFVLQGRMVQPVESTNTSSVSGTSFSALAMKLDGSSTVQLEIVNSEIVFYLGGEEVDFAGLAEQRLGNVTFTKESNSTFTVRLTAGVSIQLSSRNHILTNIIVTIPEHFSTRGLLGQFNGDPSDDLLPKNSTVALSTNSTMEEIHHHFGLSCKDYV